MEQHFITVNCYSTKNKAHEKAQQFVAKYDKCLIDDLKLSELLDLFKKEIRAINEKYTRCQNIKWGTSSFTDGHSSFFVEGNFHMSITEVRRYEISVPECKHPYTDYDGTSEHATCKSCGERVKVNGWKEPAE